MRHRPVIRSLKSRRTSRPATADGARGGAGAAGPGAAASLPQWPGLRRWLGPLLVIGSGLAWAVPAAGGSPSASPAGSSAGAAADTGAGTSPSDAAEAADGTDGADTTTAAEAGRRAERRAMVDSQISRRDIRDPAVLAAMARVPRHRFVTDAQQDAAHDDRPLSIGHGQTISQPYIVALMTELVRPAAGQRALEIGTGSGYQAAVLAELGLTVDSIEIVPQLAATARARLARLGYDRVTVRTGDGHHGWPERAPYDIVMLTAAPPEIPAPLLAQLKAGGRLVAPVGPANATQALMLVEKDAAGALTTKQITFVRFVPFTSGPRPPDPDGDGANR